MISGIGLQRSSISAIVRPAAVTLAIKHMRGSTQFIGCSRYPECTFNIGLPVTQWGWAVRTDDICEKHHLHFVRLVRKGARPWDIGCPLCHHITSNVESLIEIPSMNETLLEKARAHHIYTVAEIARSEPESLVKVFDISLVAAQKLKSEAGDVLEKLRRRSECRKFMRNHLIPRKGRSYAKIMSTLKEHGVTDLASLAKASPATIQQAGIGENESVALVNEARVTHNSQVLKEIGIPAISLKKYIAAGITGPEDFASHSPENLGKKAGMSVGTSQPAYGSRLRIPAPACSCNPAKKTGGKGTKRTPLDQRFDQYSRR